MNKPAPNQIKALRDAARLSQSEAAELVHATRRTWQNWEAPEGTANHRAMPPAAWELFEAKAALAVVAFERCTSREAILETAAQISAELDL
jgi:transcriptional regulator with XRE-family HTH domain